MNESSVSRRGRYLLCTFSIVLMINGSLHFRSFAFHGIGGQDSLLQGNMATAELT
jgi:hypothetical protein